MHGPVDGNRAECRVQCYAFHRIEGSSRAQAEARDTTPILRARTRHRSLELQPVAHLAGPRRGVHCTDPAGFSRARGPGHWDLASNRTRRAGQRAASIPDLSRRNRVARRSVASEEGKEEPNVRSASCLWPQQCDSAKSPPDSAFCSNGPRAGWLACGNVIQFQGTPTQAAAAAARARRRPGRAVAQTEAPDSLSPARAVRCDQMAFLWAVLCCGRYATLRISPPSRG